MKHLQELWSEPSNPSAEKIGQIIGRTRNAVIGRVNRMRSREGVERWPERVGFPRPTPKAEVRLKEMPKPKLEPSPSPPRKIAPVLPNEVTLGLSSRCSWTGCVEAKTRGNYCKEHAEVMYVPRKAY